ncbi:MAG: VWA domain-containing protein [Thermoanaerobaculia bacterium]
MKIFPLAPALLLLAAWIPPASAQSGAASFGEAVDVNVVNVDVYVTGKDGQRVTGLGKNDFELLEDGKPVAVTNFEVMTPEAAREAGSAPASSGPPAAAAPEAAWNLVLFFDNSNIVAAHRNQAVKQLRDFVERELGPADRVMLVSFDQGLRVRLPFTTDRARLASALEELKTAPSRGPEADRDRRQAFDAMMSIQQVALMDPSEVPCPQNIVTPAMGYADNRRQEVRRTISALMVLVNSLSGVPGRKALLHVSDGLPINPGEELFQFLVELCGGGGVVAGIGASALPGASAGARAEGKDPDANQVFDAREIGPRAYQAASQGPLDAQKYSVAKELQALASHANAQRVTLYALQAGSAAPTAADASMGPQDRMFQFASIGSVLRANQRESLQLLADETGGKAILDTNNFLPDLGRMRQDALSYYSLAYSPSHNGDGREHAIKVKVRRPGLKLRYRQSYRDKPAVERLVDRTYAALLYGFEDNPLGITVEIGEQSPGPSGLWTVPVRLRIPLFKLAVLNRDETYEGSLRLLVATRTPDGGTSPIKQVPVPIKIPRKEVLHAMGEFYLYTLTLNLPAGEQRLAVAVRDELAAVTTYLSRDLTAGPPKSASN